MTDKHLLKPPEAARRLGFASAQTFLRWAKREGFPLMRLSRSTIRVRESDVEEYLRTSADSYGL